MHCVMHIVYLNMIIPPVCDWWCRFSIDGLSALKLTCRKTSLINNYFTIVSMLVVDEKNLEHCVRYLETLPGGVGGGENSRYRAQGVKLKKRDTIFQSLANLRTAIQLANVLDDTDWIVWRMAKPVPSGGVYGVGRFHAQQIINVAVNVGLIRKCVHLEKVCISGSTHTAEVLREKFDVDIEKDIMGLSVFLGKKLRKSPSEVENMLCEAIRWRYRRGMATKKDVFVRGHELFVVKDGQVVSFSSKGCSTIHTFAVPSIQKRRKYGEKWWTGGWQRACNDVDLLLKGKRE